MALLLAGNGMPLLLFLFACLRFCFFVVAFFLSFFCSCFLCLLAYGLLVSASYRLNKQHGVVLVFKARKPRSNSGSCRSGSSALPWPNAGFALCWFALAWFAFVLLDLELFLFFTRVGLLVFYCRPLFPGLLIWIYFC